MSLISDALKKAQRQRTVEAPGAEGPRVIIRRGSTPAAKQIFLVAGGVVVVVVAVAIIAVLKLRPSDEEIAARVALATAKAKSAPPAKNANSEPAGPTPTLAPTAAPAAAKAPEASPIVVLKIPTTGGAAAAPPVAPAPERPALVASPQTAPGGTARPASSGSLQDYIDTLRVTGWSVGATPADSKVMINDKVYRINDVVDRALGLKLTDVKSDRIILSDERGGTYVRRL